MKVPDPSRNATIKNWAHDDKPREKLLEKGATSLSTAELLAVLLRTGNQDHSAVELARNVFRAFGDDLTDLGKKGVKELTAFKGIGDAKAISLVAAMELGRRRMIAKKPEKPLIKSSEDVYPIVSSKMVDLPHEEFWIMTLNRANRVVSHHLIGRGGISGAIADTRLIFKFAIQDTASSIICYHNHPSGNRKPSNADIQLTQKLKQAGDILDISLLDHLIITEEGYFSFVDEGKL